MKISWALEKVKAWSVASQTTLRAFYKVGPKTPVVFTITGVKMWIGWLESRYKHLDLHTAPAWLVRREQMCQDMWHPILYIHLIVDFSYGLKPKLHFSRGHKPVHCLELQVCGNELHFYNWDHGLPHQIAHSEAPRQKPTTTRMTWS